jgi:hypothetical protein
VPGRLNKKLVVAVGVAVWLVALLVDRVAPGTRDVLNKSLAVTGSLAGIFIVAVFYISASSR